MLEFLRIKNVALIEDVELEFSKGLNVLTGESGVGKSFILRALDFVLGEGMPKDIIRYGKEKAFVEAIFFIDGEELLIRREILKGSGRSKIFINDMLSSRTRLKELRSRLILYTSQHEQHKLLSPAYHTSILDSGLPSEVFFQRDKVLKELKELDDKRDSLIERVEELKSRRDFLEFQLRQIEEVNPQVGEEEELYARRDELKRQMEICEGVHRALELLTSQPVAIRDNLLELIGVIESLAQVQEDFKKIGEELSSWNDILEELECELRGHSSSLDVVEEIDRIEKRLWELQQLKKKLGRSLEEVLSLREELAENLSFLDRSTLDLREMEEERKEAIKRLSSLVQEINRLRKERAGGFALLLKKELTQLGFSKDVEILFEFFPREIYPGIMEDRARIYWRPNPGQNMHPLDKIVSGGELSRVMLALISASAPDDMPTIIFDEVDTGIGGVTLTKVGQKIKELSKRHQIILITHWPQLAYLADTHIKIEKVIKAQRTYTRSRVLKGKEITKEIARMAGGGPEGMALAQELLRNIQ